MIDYREKKNRREGFIRWYAWSLKYKDCDPSVWLTNYLHDRYEHNIEQKYWFCWLYANTYQLPTSWIIFNEFPDFELVTYDKLNEWNSKNYSRLYYQTDCKYNKGHLAKMFLSYKEIMKEDQHHKISSLLVDDPQQNFDILYKWVCENYFKFGRYTTWFYLQHLKHTVGVNLEPSSLLLKDYSGSKSHRNGLLYALGRDIWINEKLSLTEYELLEKEALAILQEMKDRFPELISDIDFFTMETVLCSYKKLFREKHGRYLGYYIGRQYTDIRKTMSGNWPGIDWDVLFQAREETLDHRVLENKIYEERFSEFLNTGNYSKLELMFPEDIFVEDNLMRFL